jgi:hypothetical protein
MSSQAQKQADGHPKIQVKEKIFIKKKTTADTGSGFEQAWGHQLRAYILTMKLMVISKLTREKKNYMGKTTAGTSSGCEEAQGHEL